MLNFQAYVAKKYPDVTVTVFFQLLFSTVQCGVFALIAVRDPTEWKLNFDIGLVGVLYQVENDNETLKYIYICVFYFNFYN